MNWLTQPLSWPERLSMAAIWLWARNIAWREWPMWSVPVQAGCAGVLCVLSASAVGLLWPSSDLDLAQLQASHQAMRAQVQTQQTRLEGLKLQALHESESAPAGLKAQQAWPSTAQAQSVLMALSQQALSKGLQWDFLKPEALVIQPEFAVLPVRLRLRGSFVQVVAWSHALFQQDPLWVPEKWILSAQSDSQVVLDAELHGYLRHDDGFALQAVSAAQAREEVPGWSTAQAVRTDPFHRSAVPLKDNSALAPLDRNAHPLLRWPLASLSMVGSVSSQGKRHALVQTPAGLFQVTVGDPLGAESGQVLSLDETQMQVRLPQGRGPRQAQLATLSLAPVAQMAPRAQP